MGRDGAFRAAIWRAESAGEFTVLSAGDRCFAGGLKALVATAQQRPLVTTAAARRPLAKAVTDCGADVGHLIPVAIGCCVITAVVAAMVVAGE